MTASISGHFVYKIAMKNPMTFSVSGHFVY